MGGLLASKIIGEIDGTDDRKVIWKSSISRPKPSSKSVLNGGPRIRSCPESQGYRLLQMRPWPKWVGSKHSVRRNAATPKLSRNEIQRARSERWVWTTPLGVPVDPEVKSISASQSNWAWLRKSLTLPASPPPSKASQAVVSMTVKSASAIPLSSDALAAESTSNSRGLTARAKFSISKTVSRLSIGTKLAPQCHTARMSRKNSSLLL